MNPSTLACGASPWRHTRVEGWSNSNTPPLIATILRVFLRAIALSRFASNANKHPSPRPPSKSLGGFAEPTRPATQPPCAKSHSQRNTPKHKNKKITLNPTPISHLFPRPCAKSTPSAQPRATIRRDHYAQKAQPANTPPRVLQRATNCYNSRPCRSHRPLCQTVPKRAAQLAGAKRTSTWAISHRHTTPYFQTKPNIPVFNPETHSPNRTNPFPRKRTQTQPARTRPRPITCHIRCPGAYLPPLSPFPSCPLRKSLNPCGR